MNRNPKILVLKRKELSLAALILILGVLFILLILALSGHNKKKQETDSACAVYQPGMYSTFVCLGDNTFEIQVYVDETMINDIRLVNLNDTVSTLYPLMEPTFDDLASQILAEQSTYNLSYSEESRYTSLVLIDAIDASLSKAQLPQ